MSPSISRPTDERGYARLNSLWQHSRTFVGSVLAVIALLAYINPDVWSVLMIIVCMIAYTELLAPLRPNSSTQKLLLAAVGVAIITVTCVASAGMRLQQPVPLAIIIVTVLATDVGAIMVGSDKYMGLGGRWIKRPFSPELSPNKSWEGTIGGILAGVLVGGLSALMAGLLGVHLPPRIAIVLPMIAIGGVLGDLTESGWKRAVGIKDSGTILGAMGGMLDRLDSLTLGLIVGMLGILLP